MSIKQSIKKMIFILKNKRKKVQIGHKAIIGMRSKFEGKNVIKDNTFFVGDIGFGTYMGDHCEISAYIGRYCSIGRNVRTVQGFHPTQDWVCTHPAFYSTEKQAGFSYVTHQKYDEVRYADKKNKLAVKIGNDVWIGDNVNILAGVNIGDGAIIATGAVVTKDVDPYSIVGGVPAKVIRYRFPKDTIKKLLDTQWWNQSELWIKDHIDSFDHIDKFLIDRKNSKE